MELLQNQIIYGFLRESRRNKELINLIQSQEKRSINLEIKMSRKLVTNTIRMNEDVVWFLSKYSRLAAS